MIAGTLAQLQPPADEPLSEFIRDGSGYPALTVNRTQTTHGEATPQTGRVAGRVTESVQNVATGTDGDDPFIDTSRDEVVEPIATTWAADVTDSGIVLAESISDNEELPFPFDVIGALTNSSIERRQIDIRGLFESWDDDGGLSEVWMAGSDEHGAAMAYHGQASDVDPTIGLGFKRGWNGTTVRGVAWASGYIALYNARHAADGIQFVADEILRFTETWNPDEHEDQTDFEDFGGSD